MMLVLVTLLWGTSFPLTKTWQIAARNCPDGMLASSLSLLAVRMLLATVVLALIRPHLLFSPTRREHAMGALLGVLMFVSLALQFWGIVWASPALSAFLTSLGSAWVPILAWVCFGILVPRLTIIGLLIGITGVAVLTLQPSRNWSIGRGETLTLLSTIPFAMQILVLDRVGRKIKGARLTIAMLFTTGLLAMAGAMILAAAGNGLGTWMQWLGGMLAQTRILVVLLALVLFPTVLAFSWMNRYQPLVPPGQAALAYLTEPIFATLFSIPWGYDTLTIRLVAGGLLIVLGNLVVEWRAIRARQRVTSSPLPSGDR